MPGVKQKKRYARSVRFRTIASNNNQTRQTRRLELIPVLSITGQVVTAAFDRPVTINSNALKLTNIVDQVPLSPTAFEYTPGSMSSVDITFPGAAPTTITWPFEDPTIRDQVGAYVRPGDYTEPG
jgi:hypothetical protein